MSNRERTVNGLVIRAVDSGEHDRLVTLLTNGGSLTLSAKGARSLKNRNMPACRPFVYGNYEIASRGSATWLRDASVLESFPRIGKSISAIYLATYFCEVMDELSEPGSEADELLSLGLNSLYALDRGLCPEAQIKAVFEIRAAVLSGYMPELSACRVCGRLPDGLDYLDVMNGGLLCPDCAASQPKLPPDAPPGAVPADALGTRSILMPLSAGALGAFRYAAGADPKRIFSFTLSEGRDMKYFARAAETYLLSHLERGFPALKYYYEVSQ